ncbi:SMI1/KNR4 family protein [Streptomyces cinnamoneus]|uniref:SMI1/KNR4 family protein n=1 Tax=Streptomyces cinnamoneus TaxID=53446 RepID=UPI0037AB1D4F
MDLSRFHSVLGNPELNSDVVADWPSFEERIGRHLPDDYKEFVSAYGPCEIFGDLWMWHPRADMLNLEGAMDRVLAEADFMRSQFPETYPYPLHPAPNGMIPVAESQAGANIYLAPPGSVRDAWMIAVDWKSSWSLYDYGFSEFLLKALKDELDDEFFDESVLEEVTVPYRMVGNVA